MTKFDRYTHGKKGKHGEQNNQLAGEYEDNISVQTFGFYWSHESTNRNSQWTIKYTGCSILNSTFKKVKFGVKF